MAIAIIKSVGLTSVSAVLLMLACFTTDAEADPFDSYVLEFCPFGSTCPEGLNATLSYEQTAELSYTVSLGFSVDPTYEIYLDGVDFSDGFKGTDYNALFIASGEDTEGALPGGNGSWASYFDKLNNGFGCDLNDAGKKSICSTSEGNPPTLLTTSTTYWTYNLVLDDGLVLPTVESGWNMRAHLVTSDGEHVTFFSPDGEYKVPEPSTVVLLMVGMGLLPFARRRS